MTQLQESLKKKSHSDKDEHVEMMVPGDAATKINDFHSGTTGELSNFSDSRMAVLMMMCSDSATTETGNNNCSLVETIREVAASTTGEVIVVEEDWNSAAVVLGPNISPSTASGVLPLVKLAREVIGTVRARKTVELVSY